MKYITFLSLTLFCIGTIVAQKPSEQTSASISLKGKISQDSENENGGSDPKFHTLAFASPKLPGVKTGESKRITEMENGLQFIKDVVYQLIEKKYSFSLISQHKYMINDCLGIKASVGEFSVQFSKPEININNVGKVVIIMGVDEISFNALKIRMRPCPKDLQCHFSERFQIGGLARDLTMKVTMDPLAMVASSTGICALAFQGSLPIVWNIGALNLKPLQNNLDDLAKQMIEDALNGSSLNLFTDRFLSIAKSILPQYFETCKDLYTPPDRLTDIVKENTKKEEEKTTGGNTKPQTGKSTPPKLDSNALKQCEENNRLLQEKIAGLENKSGAPIDGGYESIYLDIFSDEAELQVKVNGRLIGAYNQRTKVYLDPYLKKNAMNTVSFAYSAVSKSNNQINLQGKFPADDRWYDMYNLVPKEGKLEGSFELPYAGKKKL